MKTEAQADETETGAESWDKFVFRDLPHFTPIWDSPNIRHFSPSTFVMVAERCAKIGVAMYGIEVFSLNGELLEIFFDESDEPLWAIATAQRLQAKQRILISATYDREQSGDRAA